MDVDLKHLPADIEQLRSMVGELVAEHEHALSDERQAYRELSEKFEALRRLHFGQSSEKLKPEDIRQMLLFNEAEAGATELSALTAGQGATVHIAEHERTKPGRKPIADQLPREVVIHDLTEEEKRCPCCGEERPVVSEETSEEASAHSGEGEGDPSRAPG